jgi:hypothetical protein
MPFRIRSRHDFFGGGGGSLPFHGGSGTCATLLLGVIFLRDPEFEVSDRHDPWSIRPSSRPGEGICLFVARRALVALDPDEIDGFALAAQFAHYVPDVSGTVWPGPAPVWLVPMALVESEWIVICRKVVSRPCDTNHFTACSKAATSASKVVSWPPRLRAPLVMGGSTPLPSLVTSQPNPAASRYDPSVHGRYGLGVRGCPLWV